METVIRYGETPPLMLWGWEVKLTMMIFLLPVATLSSLDSEQE